MCQRVQNLEKSISELQLLQSETLSLFQKNCEALLQQAGPKAVDMDTQIRECDMEIHNAEAALDAITKDTRRREEAIRHANCQLEVLQSELGSLQRMEADGISSVGAILRDLSDTERMLDANPRSAESHLRSYYESQLLQHQIRLASQNKSTGNVSQRIQQVSATLATRNADLARLRAELKAHSERVITESSLFVDKLKRANATRDGLVATAASLKNDFGIIGEQLIHALSAVRELTWMQHSNACMYAPLVASVTLLKSAVEPFAKLLQSDEAWDQTYACRMLKSNLPLLHSAGVYGRLGAEEVQRINQVVIKVDFCLKNALPL